MNKDIFDDMIDYGDDISDEETESIKEDVSEIEEEIEEEVSETEEEENIRVVSEYTEDMDEPDDDYEFIRFEDDDDRLIEPLVKPILKWLLPVVVLVGVIVFITTSQIPGIKAYRENFAANIAVIMDNMGISFEKEEEPEKEGNPNAMKYRDIDETNSADNVQYRTGVASDVKLTFEGASKAQFVTYGEGFVCAKTNYICYINKFGEIEWEKNVSIIEPILKCEGEYILLAQRDGTKFVLYRDSEEIYFKNTDDNILTANVSANGDVVLVTDKNGYKGAVNVYNKRGDVAFSWLSGNAFVISADIAAQSRRVAVALLNTDDTVTSSVQMFDIKKPDSYAQYDLDDAIIYNVDFKDDYLSVFSDKALVGMAKSGKIMYTIDFGAAEPSLSNIDENGDKVLVFTSDNIPMINIYNKRGKLKNTISASKLPNFADVIEGNVIYNVDREVFLSKYNTRIPYKYTAAMDIQKLIPIDEKSFAVVYSNSLSVVRMKGVIW